ncbi:MarR family winged helix-turn-helix transcriptional regulator [Actinopolymorpha alba]|uniref:MarR family winged helix-turn-helix transcriptional regulator n=1 Tax=Actinopolymorpha alba TaxID=533267 RepID=UPI00035C21D2|nr:MarR family winged helix-turn-helix transcriptional regulator [Actinopolymorpha alba]
MPGNSGDRNADVKAVEQAMVSLRRSMSRRTLARAAERAPGRRGRQDTAVPAANTAAFEVLDAVEAAEQAGVPFTVSGVADALQVDQPRASKLVAAAVEAGLVRREADQSDGRRALLVRTAAGRALSERVHRFRRSVFSSAMSGWSETDRAEFARLLTRFVDGLSRQAR